MTTTVPARPGHRGQHPSPTDARRLLALAALAGVLAAGLTLGVAQLVAAAVAPSAAPVLAVGDAFVDLTPGWLKDFAIEQFGTSDKLVLLVCMGVVIAVLAAVAGALGLRRRRLAQALVVLLGVVAAVAAFTRPDAAPLSVLPSLLGTGAGLIALNTLLDRLVASAAPGTARADGADRRSFLVAAGVTAALAAATAVGGRVVGAASRSVTAARQALRLPAAAVPAAAVPAGVGAGVDGVVPWVSPNDGFYRIDTALTVPQVDPAQWSLRVHGMVEEEVVIDFDELSGSDLVETWLTLTCVSNEVGGDLAGNAKWLGMPVRDLLRRARPLPGADMVLSTSEDGWTASTPLEVLTDDGVDALLAIGMNDEPLPTQHGFPVRMVTPGLYGFVSATKWVVDLEVTRFADRTAYWTDRGWSESGVIKTASRIEVPEPLTRVPAGPAVAAGTAWAQTRGISGVEVQVDDQPWAAAELAVSANDQTWVQWRFAWDATPGQHDVRVRATDGEGVTQPEERVDPVPDGATGWHSISVTAEES